MSEHTPGPWTQSRNYHHIGPLQGIFIQNDDTRVAYILSYGVVGSHITCEANARLIAAAPQMREALEECLREHGGYTIKGECERKARAALKAADGEGT